MFGQLKGEVRARYAVLQHAGRWMEVVLIDFEEHGLIFSTDTRLYRVDRNSSQQLQLSMLAGGTNDAKDTSCDPRTHSADAEAATATHSTGESGGREGLPSTVSACRRWPLRNTGVN